MDKETLAEFLLSNPGPLSIPQIKRQLDTTEPLVDLIQELSREGRILPIRITYHNLDPPLPRMPRIQFWIHAEHITGIGYRACVMCGGNIDVFDASSQAEELADEAGIQAGAVCCVCYDNLRLQARELNISNDTESDRRGRGISAEDFHQLIRNPRPPPRISSGRQRVLELLEQTADPITTTEVLDQLNISRRHAYMHLRELTQELLIHRVTRNGVGYYLHMMHFNDEQIVPTQPIESTHSRPPESRHTNVPTVTLEPIPRWKEICIRILDWLADHGLLIKQDPEETP